MGCKSDRNSDEKRFQTLASTLPLIRGSIIKDDGTITDLAEILGVEKTPIDKQLAKAQNTFPYLRNTVIFEDGQTTTLLELIDALLTKIQHAAEVYSDELRLDHVVLTKEDWGDDDTDDIPYADDLNWYYYKLKEDDWYGS